MPFRVGIGEAAGAHDFQFAAIASAPRHDAGVKWRTYVGWTAVLWGSGTVVLAVVGVLDDVVAAVAIGAGLAMSGLSLLLQARTMRNADRTA